jgi:Dolichyl-phosphate-mannose-protein mannosyltransferase
VSAVPLPKTHQGLTEKSALPSLWQRPKPLGAWRLLLHPLTAICAVQAVLSVTLVWSNTAFGDEADYLWLGRLEWEHWLHGAPWPSAYADQYLSGLPTAYPPLGAVADSIGGLATARILSLVFMLCATVLLYLTASRLIGRRGAIIGSALWALSEPSLRLAFATYDPLSVMLTALSAWLVVQASYRRHSGAFVAMAAATLALANTTAYSGIVIDPVMICFAFLVWLPRGHAKKSLFQVVCFAAGCTLFFGLIMTASGSWRGLMFTIIHRSFSDHQSSLLVLNDIWQYSGLIICLAIIGIVVALGTESWRYGSLMALLGCAALIVPAVQLKDQTGWSLDKHLAYGIWFASIAVGYACNKLIDLFPRANWRFVAVCCVVALAYPAASSWQSAWQVYHSWANTKSFIASLAPLARENRGFIFTDGQQNVAGYYIRQVKWTQLRSNLPLNPKGVARDDRVFYYAQQLKHSNYGVIALIYPTTFSSAPEMPSTLLLPPSSSRRPTLLSLVGEGSGQLGLPALTQALEADRRYRLVHVGPFDSAHKQGLYAIWQKKAQA